MFRMTSHWEAVQQKLDVFLGANLTYQKKNQFWKLGFIYANVIPFRKNEVLVAGRS